MVFKSSKEFGWNDKIIYELIVYKIPKILRIQGNTPMWSKNHFVVLFSTTLILWIRNKYCDDLDPWEITWGCKNGRADAAMHFYIHVFLESWTSPIVSSTASHTSTHPRKTGKLKLPNDEKRPNPKTVPHKIAHLFLFPSNEFLQDISISM